MRLTGGREKRQMGSEKFSTKNSMIKINGRVAAAMLGLGLTLAPWGAMSQTRAESTASQEENRSGLEIRDLQAKPEPADRKPWTVGAHGISWHSGNRTELNNNNFGLYVKSPAGWTAGFYHNSEWKMSHYIGWTTPSWHGMEAVIGAIDGYKVNDGGWIPMVIPSWSAPIEGSSWRFRVAAVPSMKYPINVVHFMIENRF